MKISECAELYLSYIADKSENTVKNYRSDLKQFIEIVGDKDVETVAKPDIAKFRMVLQSKRKKSSTIARKLACINSFFEYLMDLELVNSSPITKSHRPKISQKIPSALSNQEVQRVLKSARTLQEKTILIVMLTTGLRSSELLGIKRRNLILYREDRTYGIEHLLETGLKENDIVYIRVLGKGDKEREVPIVGKPLEIFYNYLQSHNFEEVFPISYHMLRRKIIDIGKRAAVDLHPHKLRHTAATLALQSGAELRVIQELLGHASPLTTARYAKVGQKQLLSATKSLSESILSE